MINYLYLKFFYIFILFQILLRFEKCDEYTTHPLNIIIDSANLNIENILHNKILAYLTDSVEILSKMINCIDELNNEITPDIIVKKCKRQLKISNISTYNSDLVILPIFEKFKRNYDTSGKFQVLICDLNLSRKHKPNIVLFLINNYLDLNSLPKTDDQKYSLILEILRYLFDCLGLKYNFRANIKQARNNFFETPLYLLNNSFSYKSLIKLYKLLNVPIPKRKINDLGLFYEPYWPKDYIIKDFLSQEIDIEYDLTETSFNLLKDLNYYTISKCDMILDNKGKCHRIDQKCISKEEFDNEYYLQYGIDNSKIICYLSNKYNLLNKKCGNKYGLLINEVIDNSSLIKKEIIKNNLGNYFIPELLNYDEIEFKLNVPSEKCHSQMPRTIYFRRDFKTNFFNLNDILLTKENRRFFITFATFEDIYFIKEFMIIAKFNGLIRSFLDYGNHNLFIYTLDEEFLKENSKNLKLNKFQKFFNFVGSEIFSGKDSLYTAYKNQKRIYGKEYYYMIETYSYPEQKDFINKKFSNYKMNINDLWLIKPKNKYSENIIHIFKSLNNESENFIITKYISNIHLINGKKYNIRFFALVSGLKPLRIYLNKEGIVQIAREKYSLNISKLNNKYVNFVNMEINNEFESGNKKKKELGNKLSLTKYIKYLEENDIDYSSLKEKIIDIIIKTIISCYEHLLSKLDKYNLNDRNFFNLFGYDILIDNNYEPILLGVENRPDMHIYDKIDKIIKEKIFIDVLNIIGIIPFSHDENQESLDEIFSYDDPIEESVDFAFCELTRPQGNFELIFPLENNIDKYKKLIRIKNKENEQFWKKIKNDD